MSSKQVILVTGASTGFGRLVSETLARRGHTVYATMRDPKGRNTQNASEIRTLASKESLPLHVLELDVTDEASTERAVNACVEQVGKIDVAINNAGYVVAGLTEAVTVEQSRAQMDTNFLGAVRVNRAVLPHMRRQRSGLLMHISSGAGRIVLPGYAFYCASKFAMEAMAEAYHYELAGQGIDSCIIEPGAYRTAVMDNSIQAADKSRTEGYGPVAQIPDKVTAALLNVAANAQEVADALASIIETPAGQRKLRYRISPTDLGVDEINAVCARVQQSVLEVFGLTADTAFAQQRAAGTTR